MAAEKWRVVVTMHDEAKRRRDEEADQTAEEQHYELEAAAFLFEVFLKSSRAKDAARMYARFGGSLVIVELDHREKDRDSLFYDIFGGRGLSRTQRKFGNEYADEVAARTPQEVVGDWFLAAKGMRRAYEFLPWLFAEFDAFADKHRAELARIAAEKEEEFKWHNMK